MKNVETVRMGHRWVLATYNKYHDNWHSGNAFAPTPEKAARYASSDSHVYYPSRLAAMRAALDFHYGHTDTLAYAIDRVTSCGVGEFYACEVGESFICANLSVGELTPRQLRAVWEHMNA